MVDLLYLAKNRLEFTRESFSMLVANTDWDLVQEFHVFDDGSTDGTVEYLNDVCSSQRSVDVNLTRTDHNSPVLSFNTFVRETSSEFVVKIDNDCGLPKHWLSICLQIFEASPELQCLGIEPFYEVDNDMLIVRTWEPARYTGGIGVFRRETFERRRLPTPRNVYFGFGDWQEANGITCGWIRPSLPVFLLDHLPFEPWRSLSKLYREKGWQRLSWGEYERPSRRTNQDHGPELWSWWFDKSCEIGL